jgi:DNA-binding GntR family transcriptional regulator
MSRAVDLGDIAAIDVMNERVHFSVYRAAASETRVSVIEGLWQHSDRIWRCSFAGSSTERASRSALPFPIITRCSLHWAGATLRRRAKYLRVDIIESARWYQHNLPDDQPSTAHDRVAP